MIVPAPVPSAGSIGCGSVGIIMVGCVFFPVGRAVLLPSVTWTLSSSRSANRHSPVHWRFLAPLHIWGPYRPQDLLASWSRSQSHHPSGGRTRLPPVPGTCLPPSPVCGPHLPSGRGPCLLPAQRLRRGHSLCTCLQSGCRRTPAVLCRHMALLKRGCT